MSTTLSISREGLSDAEWKNVGVLVSHLAMLESFVQDFSDALGLIDHSLEVEVRHEVEEYRRILNWSNMGRFYALFALYHFHTSMKAIRERVRNNKALADRWDIHLINDVISRFETTFPNLKVVRDSAAHQSDRMFKVEDIEKHGNEGIMLPLQYWNGQYGASHEGDFVGLHLTEDELNELEGLRLEILGIFQGTNTGAGKS